MFDQLGEAQLLDTMRESARAERITVARRVLAAGRLCQIRLASAEPEREQWCIDNWEALAAEVGAELGISRARASSQLHYGLQLLERLPKLAAVFAAGELDYRLIVAIDFRTGLITDPDVLARLDVALADEAPSWNTFSRDKITQLIDWLVVDLDPDARRITRQHRDDRRITVTPGSNGLAEIWGSVHAPDAVALDRRLDALADTVCSDDPRNTAQRRADALGALAAGQPNLACGCGLPSCGATSDASAGSAQIVIHVLAESRTVDGAATVPGYLPGYGSLPASTVQQLAKNARLRPIARPGDLVAESRYRPSPRLADFIRCRDLTCRFPGCDCPAELADIDHTVPYPTGPTHASNLKILCRAHHLLKTFWTGPGGWNDRQLPDGTILWTSPNGRRYTTRPHGGLFFPQLAVSTGELNLPSTGSTTTRPRALAMPTRARTRKQEHSYRVQWERARNQASDEANPPPF